MSISRRNFLIATGAGATAFGLGLYYLKPRSSRLNVPPITKTRSFPRYESWGDVYRDKWQWDRVVKGTHNRANCFSACSWDLYVKEGIVWREEQADVYTQTNDSVPDFSPRGCQKGACYSDLHHEPSRITHPLKRVGERGGGKWKRISWDEAFDEIADAVIDAAVEGGGETIVFDGGTTNGDFGPDSFGEMRWANVLGATTIDSWAGVGDMPNGILQTWGMFNADGTTDDWFYSDYIILWVSNPVYTRIPDIHFIHEARYRGAKLVVISPDFSASTVHADLWINIEQETDAAFGLAVANVIIEETLYDDTAVREQTDLAFLVREDTGRYLREEDLNKAGKEDLFYLWDEKTNKPVKAPGCKGDGSRSIALGNIQPAIDGSWEVKLANGQAVRVRRLFQVLGEHLNVNYTPEKQEELTGIRSTIVRHFARELASAPTAMVYTSWGACKNYHSDLFQRVIAMLMAITGNQGKKGGGVRIAAWWPFQGTDELGASEFDQPISESIKLVSKFISGFTPTDWEDLYTQYSAYLPITPLMPFLYVHGGYDKVWDLEEHQDPTMPRTTREYMDEAIEKGWMPIHPEPGNRPRVYVFTGCNPLRRWPMPQHAKKHFWPSLDLIVSANFRMSTSTLHS